MAQPATEMRHNGRFHVDYRGIRYCDIFPEIEKGDINVSIIEPGAAALWHRHRKQADYQIVVHGSLKIGMCNMPNFSYDRKFVSDEAITEIDAYQEPFIEEWSNIKEEYNLTDWPSDNAEVRWNYLSDKNCNEGALHIPTGIWHGCYNYTFERAILIYHITEKYSSDDEERLDPVFAMWDYERVNH